MRVKRLVEPPITEAEEEEAMLAEAAEHAEAMGAERAGAPAPTAEGEGATTMVEVLSPSDAETSVTDS